MILNLLIFEINFLVSRDSDCEPLHQQLAGQTALAQAATRQGQGELKRWISQEQTCVWMFLSNITIGNF